MMAVSENLAPFRKRKCQGLSNLITLFVYILLKFPGDARLLTGAAWYVLL